MSKPRAETIATTEYRYTVVFEPAEEGGYVVHVPALPRLVTEGDTLDEARAMARETVIGYLESLRETGEEIPTEAPNTITEKIGVTLART